MTTIGIRTVMLLACAGLVFGACGSGGGATSPAVGPGSVQASTSAPTTSALVEDFELLPVQQTTAVSGYGGGDAYYGLFDDAAETTPVELRTTLGEAGVRGYEARQEGSGATLNTFGRGTIDAEASYQDDVEYKDFIGILDFPSGCSLLATENGVGNYTAVGDFAGLRDQPIGVDGATFSIDVRIPQALDFAVYVRFLFSDADDQAAGGTGECETEEYVTDTVYVPDDGRWHTVSFTIDDTTPLYRLTDDCTPPSGESWVFSRESIWPISVEILRQASIGTQSQDMVIDFDNFSAAGVVLPGADDPGCTYSHGYWKNHTDDWPVDSLVLGGESRDADTLLDWLKQSTKGDAWKILARQWVAAMLNVANGADDGDVADELDDAAAWLAEHEDGYEKSEKSEATSLASVLDDYNNGEIGPGSCED